VLSTTLNGLRLATESLTYKPRENHLVINWGNSKQPVWSKEMLNNPDCVAVAKDKINTFISLDAHDVSIPEWTIDSDEARGWVDDNKIVLARTKVDGHSGEGIVILTKEVDFVAAPLYTVYKKKRNEYRVHVFLGEVIDVTEKKRELDVERGQFENFIRSHKNGWVFCRDGVVVSDDLKSIAIQAINALSLDFGAVDIIYNQHENKYYVLEINTAPALAGTTLDSYVSAITKLL
jgi:hypothetical protein